eukprot:CCRYP_016840-RA/>CCRYP_016840-RA protein AED:0.20 eAED:0.20 QI:0/-1/0/1/-1/1/1/0/302
MAPHDDALSNTAVVSSAAPILQYHISSSIHSKEPMQELPSTPDDGAGAHSLIVDADGHGLPSPSLIDTPIRLPLVGILKSPSRYSSQQQQQQQHPEADNPDGSDDRQEENDSAPPSHWPMYRPSVHFIDDPANIHPSSSIVTSIYYRPYTPYSDLSKLYYSSSDFAHFKREYRALVNAQRRRNRDAATDAKNGGGLMKNSSFWRSKVHGRYYDASHSTFCPSSNDGNEECNSSSSHQGQLSTAAIFSSVFDVAREAVSIFSGSSNYSYYQNQCSSPPQKQHGAMSKARQQQLMVDTLYLNLF